MIAHKTGPVGCLYCCRSPQALHTMRISHTHFASIEQKTFEWLDKIVDVAAKIHTNLASKQSHDNVVLFQMHAAAVPTHGREWVLEWRLPLGSRMWSTVNSIKSIDKQINGVCRWNLLLACAELSYTVNVIFGKIFHICAHCELYNNRKIYY